IKTVENNLRQEIAGLRQETKSLENNLRQEIADLRQETKSLENNLRQEIADLAHGIKGLFWATIGIAVAALAVTISVAIKVWR
ncbi:MAG: DUF1640 domain-containing protein, partial [Thermoanaerobacteraceae bacterium]|nr:DUF1640 domain-containing protein [Thermoanaerobacteraceae bacterium]